MRQPHKKEALLALTERELGDLLKSELPHAVQNGWNAFENSRFDPYRVQRGHPSQHAERLLTLAITVQSLRSELDLPLNEGPAHAFLRACEENADTAAENRLGPRRLAERLLGELTGSHSGLDRPDQGFRLKQIKLPASERFACSPRSVKAVFRLGALEWISFGNPIRSFSFDSRARKIPKLSGPVVASSQVYRDGRAHLCLFPLRRDAYSSEAAESFVESVLPRLAQWLADMRARPATAVVGLEQAVVEWASETHVIHFVTFL